MGTYKREKARNTYNKEYARVGNIAEYMHSDTSDISLARFLTSWQFHGLLPTLYGVSRRIRNISF